MSQSLTGDTLVWKIVCILCVLVDGVCMDRGDEDIEWSMGWGDSSQTEQEPVFRVVNGQPANLGDIPYQVALRLPLINYPGQYKSFCGGALISVDQLLTAAHCFHTLMPTNYSIGAKNVSLVFAVAGSITNFDKLWPVDSPGGGQWRRLRSVQRPRGYSFPDHDIALVITESKFKFNDFVLPIPVASQYSEYVEGECLVAGYGRTSAESVSRALLVGFLQPMPVQECSRLYHRNMSRFVCTATTVADVAKGDSGGPLVCRNTGDKNENQLGLLVGIISASATVRLHGRTDRQVHSAFFTRVSEYTKHFSITVSAAGGTGGAGGTWGAALAIYVTLFSS